jgi:hypothetical protein
VALALQIVDREVELGPYGLPAFDPEGLHEQVGVAIHFPSTISATVSVDWLGRS